MRICGKSSCNCCQFQHYSTLTTYNIENCFEIKSTFKAIFFLNFYRHAKHTTLQTSHFQPIKTKNQVILKKKVETFNWKFCKRPITTGNWNTLEFLFISKYRVVFNWNPPKPSNNFFQNLSLQILLQLPLKRLSKKLSFGSFNTLIFFPYWWILRGYQ